MSKFLVGGECTDGTDPPGNTHAKRGGTLESYPHKRGTHSERRPHLVKCLTSLADKPGARTQPTRPTALFSKRKYSPVFVSKSLGQMLVTHNDKAKVSTRAANPDTSDHRIEIMHSIIHRSLVLGTIRHWKKATQLGAVDRNISYREPYY